MNGQPPHSEQRGTSEAFQGRCHQVRVIESWSIGDVMPGPHGPNRPPSKVSGPLGMGSQRNSRLPPGPASAATLMTLNLFCGQGSKRLDTELDPRHLPGDARCQVH